MPGGSDIDDTGSTRVAREIPLAAIQVGERLRQLDPDKVAELAESIAVAGLLQPVVVTDEGLLAAGHHRLAACRSLGWDTIPAIAVPARLALLVEIDENLRRADLTVLQQAEHLEARNQELERLGLRAPSHRPQEGKGATVAPLKTTKNLAAEIGLSKRSAQLRMQIARQLSPATKNALRGTLAANATRALRDLCQLEGEEQTRAAERLASGQAQTVLEARRQLWREANDAKQRAILESPVEAPTGRYHTLVLDPPWPLERMTRHEWDDQVGWDYPRMSLNEIRDIPIPDLAEEDCHLYLWAPHKFIPDAIDLVRHWGFGYRVMLTWSKNMGMTPYSWHYTTEHCIFATKGTLRVIEKGIRLDFQAPVVRHSKKPDVFYDIVCRASPGPRLEMFSRKRREGFEAHGNQVGMFDEEDTETP